MAFDVNGALKAGYSMTEIADHLARGAKFNSMSARQAGYSDEEIVNHLLQGKGKQVPARQSVAPADVRAIDSSLISTPDVTAPVTDSFISAKAPVAAAQPSKRRASSDINPELRSAPQQSIIARGLNAVRRALSPYDTTEAMDPADIAAAQIAMETGKGTDTVVEPSRRIEKAVKPLPGLAASTLQQGEGGLVREVGEMSPNTRAAYLGPVAGPLSMLVPWDKITEAGKSYAESGVKEEKRLREKYPAEPGTLTSMVQSAGQSFGMQLIPMLASIVTANPAPALAAMSGITMGQTYHDYRERGHSPEASAIAAAGQGIIEGGTELLPVTKLLNIAGGKQALVKSLIELYGSEVPGEMIATLTQDMIDKSMIRPNMTVGEMGQEIKKYFASGEAALAQKETVGSTLIQTTATAGLGVGARTLTRAAANLNNRTDPITGGLTITSPAASGMPLLTQEQAARRDKLSNIMQGETEEAAQARLQAIEARKQGASRGLTAATAPATPQTAAPQEPVTTATQEAEPAASTIIDEALADPEASRKALADLETRHAKLKSKIFDEEGNQREGISQKVLDNYNALTATIENQRAKLAPEATAGEEATNGQEEVRREGRGQEVTAGAGKDETPISQKTSKQRGWNAAYLLAQIARQNGTDLTKLSRTEYADFAVDHGAILEDDQLRMSPALRSATSIQQIMDMRKVNRERLNQHNKESIEFYNEMLNMNTEDNGTGVRASNNNAKSNSWFHFHINGSTNANDAKTHKGYLGFDNVAKSLTAARFKEFMAELQKAGYNGQVKSVQDTIEQGNISDQIVMHGASEADVMLAHKVAKQFWGDEVNFTDTGHDVPGKSYSQWLAEDIANGVKQSDKSSRASTSPAAPTQTNTSAEALPGRPEANGIAIPDHVARAVEEPRVVPTSVGVATKQQTKETLNAKLSNGEVASDSPIRLTTVEELHDILTTGKLREGKDFEGRSGISAQVVDGKKPIVAYGPNDRISAAIVFPKEAARGKGESANEVKVDANTDPKSLRFVIDGHAELLTFEQLQEAIGRKVDSQQREVETEKAEVGKEPWEMTREEFVKTLGMDEKFIPPQPKREAARIVKREDGSVWQTGEHGKAVYEALIKSKPVPPEVLAEYPDLAPKRKGVRAEESPKPNADAARFAETRRKNLEKRLAIARNTRERESIRAKLEKLKKVDRAAHEAATSPHNDLPEPTQAEKEAGNYKMGHTAEIHGLDISIENPAGSVRSGVSPDGKKWKTELKHHYGYIRGTVGKDKDHIDVFIGENPDSRKVFIVNQIDPGTGRFDEHKVMLGFDSEAEARKGYLANYDSTGKNRIGSIVEMDIDEFKAWLKDGDTKKAAEQAKKSPEPQNAIFTEDAYQKARARMKAKLSQLNAGFDPELLQDGMTIAGYHLERGARKFADYTKAMVDEFGDAIRPYLKAFYNGVRDLPGIEWTSEMDDYQTVQGASVDARKEGEEQPNEIQRFAEDMRQTQARWDAANDRATELGTPGALAAQEKFENGDMEVEEFERILDGEAQQKRELTPAESTKIPVIDSGKGKPNTVYRDMYGLYDGAHLGLVEEPYDGTLEGLMEAYYKVQARFNDFNNASNMESPIAATDESGKAKYRLSPNGRFIYDLQNGDEINTDAYKDKKAEAEAEIVGDTPFTLSSHDSLFKRLRDGEPVTVDEVKKGFDSLIEGEEAIKVELQAMKKDDLLKRMGRFVAGRYKNEKKDVIVSAIYRGMVTDFAYLYGSNSLSYGMRDKVSDVVRKRVEKLTEEDLKKYAEAIAKERDDYKARMEGYVKAIKNPETWEEFQKYRELGYKIEDLSPEKLKLYDELKAEHNREQKAREAEKKATVSQVKTDVEMTLKETTHTKKGTPLFVVQLSDRVERDVYNGLNAAAKKLGGYYSSFRGAGAVPGFQFKTREDAEKFMAIREGDVSRADKLEEKAEERQEKKVSKLRAVAESLKEKAEEQLSRDRLTNTAKRARQASGAEESARSDIQLAETMLNLADAIESGEATHLDGVAAKTHVETLKGLLRSAKYAYEEAKDIPYIDSKNRTVTEDDVDFAKYPYPAQHESHIRDLATFLKDKKGAAMDAAWLSKMVKERTHDSIVSFIQPGDIERLESILAKTKRFVKDSSAKSAIENIADRMQDYNRLQRMGIPDLPSLRAALREFLKFKAGRREADKAKQLERDLVGKKVGVDFFPTPPELAGRMVEMAGVEPGMRVLEPSAGNGNIAEAIRDAGAEPDVAEISPSLRKVLEAKGFAVVGQDFMDVDGEYDAIIMNPPFSDNQDIEHVRHAFDLLKPGGKLVAIMGEGAFFRGGKTENAFREWIDEQGADVEKLPEGTFTDKRLLNTTGVNARLVVVEKEGAEASKSALQAVTETSADTPAEVVQDAVKSAREAGVSLKEQKKFLLENIDEAIKAAPKEIDWKAFNPIAKNREAAEMDYDNARERKESFLDEINSLERNIKEGKVGDTELTEKEIQEYREKLSELRPLHGEAEKAVQTAKAKLDEIKSKIRDKFMVTIEVPNDGTFDVFNTKETLAKFKEQVSKQFPSAEKPSSAKGYGNLPKPTGVKAEGLEGGAVIPTNDGVWHTNGHIAVKGEPTIKFKSISENIRSDLSREEGTGMMARITPKPDTGNPVTSVEFAAGRGVMTDNADFRATSDAPIKTAKDEVGYVRLTTESGFSAILSQKLYVYAKQAYPNAEIRVKNENEPVIFVESGDVVAVVMPIRNGGKDGYFEEKGSVTRSVSPTDMEAIANNGLQDEVVSDAPVSSMGGLSKKDVADILRKESIKLVEVKGVFSDDLRRIAKAFGQEIAFYSPLRDRERGGDKEEAGRGMGSGGHTNGFVVNDAGARVVFLNTDSKSPLGFVLAHELTHRLQYEREEDYHLLAERLANAADMSRLFEYLDRQQTINPADSGTQLYGEFVANLVGERFLSKSFWNTLAQKEPSVFHRIADIALRIIGSIKKLFLESPTASSVVTDMAKAEKYIADAMRGFAGEVERQGNATKPRFSYRITPATKGTEKTAIEKAIAPLLKKWKNAPEVKVVQSESELPENLKAEMASVGAQGEIDGVFSGGVVYLIADNMPNARDAVRVLLHEAVGHYGVRGLLGKRFDTVLLDVFYVYGKDGLREIADRYGLDLNEFEDRMIACEEKLAEIAESGEKPGLVKRAIAAIREWLRSIGVNISLSDADVRAMISRAAGWVERGKGERRDDRAIGREGQGVYSKAAGGRDYIAPEATTGGGSKDLSNRITDRGRMEEIAASFTRAVGASVAPADVALWLRNELDDLGRLGRVFQKQVVMFQSEREDISGLPGFFDPNRPDTIFINTNTPAPHLTIFGHELMHAIKNQRPDLYKKFVSAARYEDNAFDDNGKYLEKIYGHKVSDEENLEEFSADYIGAKLTEKDFWERLHTKSPQLFRSALDAVKRIIRKIQGIQFRTDHIFKDMKKAEEAALDVLNRYAKGGKAGETPRFSRRNRTGDPDTDAVLDKIGRPDKTMTERLAGILDNGKLKLEQGIFDQFASLKALDKMAGVDTPDDSAYITARMTTGFADTFTAMLNHGAPIWANGWVKVASRDRGILKIFEPVANDLDLFLGWMVGERAQKLMNEGRENYFTQEEIDKLKALKTAENAARWERVRRDYVQYKKKVLDFAEQGGIINPDARRIWDHEEYVPFYRIAEDAEKPQGPTGKRGIASQNSGIRTLKGGTGQLGDIFENILRNFSHLTQAALKNRAAEIALEKAEEMGLASRAQWDWKAAHVETKQIVKKIREQLGAEDILEPEEDQLDDFMTLFHLMRPKGTSIVHVLKEGKPQYYEVHDELLLKSLTNLNAQVFQGAIMDLMRFTKRLLTIGVTSMPDFMIRNFVRDTLHTWVINRGDFTPGISSLKGAVKTFREDDDMVQLMAAGGSFHGGFAYGHDMQKTSEHVKKLLHKKGVVANILDTPAKLLDFWKKIGGAGENAARVAIYQNTVKKTGSALQAAFEAKDVMDFSMRGDFAIVKFLCETVPFLGARMQGLQRLSKAAIERPGSFIVKGGAIALAAVLLYLINRDDDRYKELEEWDKDTYFHFWIGKEHFRLPKPFEVGVLFGTIPERLTELLIEKQHDGKLFAARLLQSVTQTFAIGLPQLISEPVQQWANRDSFTGRQIVGQRIEGLKPEDQKEPWTGATAVEVGDILGVSPKRIEHAVEGYFGTLGTYILGASDIVVRRMLDYPAQPTTKLEEWPVVKSFYRGDEPPKNTKYLTEFYDLLKEVDETYNSIQEARKTGDWDRVLELRDENTELLRTRSMMEGSRDQLSAINRRTRRILYDKDMTGDEKREELDELTAKKNSVAKRAIERVESRGIQIPH